MARPSKFNWEEIKNAYECGKTVDELVSRYGVTKKTLQNKISKELWENKKRKTKKPFSKETGFVYIVYFEDSSGKKFYKIGIATNPKTRMNDLQTANPFELNVLFCFYCSDNLKLEKQLHLKFSHLNIKNEWFCLNYKSIKQIKEFILNYEVD